MSNNRSTPYSMNHPAPNRPGSRARSTLFAILATAALLGAATPARAQILGVNAQPFTVLGGASVTNTGPTTIDGNLGVNPGTSITGVGSITLGGSLHQGDAVAGAAQNAFNTAFVNLAGMPVNHDLTGQDLGGMTLLPGVYFFSSSAQLTGDLFLDFLGSSSSLFVFQIGSTLTTASNSSVSSLGGGPWANVYWQVGSSATLGTGTDFEGNIIANTSITMVTGASITCGRAIALNGSVTMDSNVLTSECADEAVVPVTATPEPATLALFAPGCIALVGLLRRRRGHTKA